jgi:hypothetical protein
MDLVREILLDVEKRAGVEGYAVDVTIEGRPKNEVAYHLRILIDGGLVDAINRSHMGGEAYLVKGLTWAGHDFLDAARSFETWEKAKETFKEKGMGMPFEVLKALLVKIITGAVIGGTT